MAECFLSFCSWEVNGGLDFPVPLAFGGSAFFGDGGPGIGLTKGQ